MKLRMKKQIICCITAIILFVSGIYLDVLPEDSSFLCEFQTPAASTDTSVRDGDHFKLAEFCTNDMLRQNESNYFNPSSKKKVSSKKDFETVVFADKAQQPVYFGKPTDYVCRQLVSSHVSVVRYIHEKDGEK